MHQNGVYRGDPRDAQFDGATAIPVEDSRWRIERFARKESNAANAEFRAANRARPRQRKQRQPQHHQVMKLIRSSKLW